MGDHSQTMREATSYDASPRRDPQAVLADVRRKIDQARALLWEVTQLLGPLVAAVGAAEVLLTTAETLGAGSTQADVDRAVAMAAAAIPPLSRQEQAAEAGRRG